MVLRLYCSVKSCHRKRHSAGLCETHLELARNMGRFGRSSEPNRNVRGWAFDGAAWVRRYRSHDLRVTIGEDGLGYRLWIDAKRRGLFDSVTFARAHGLYLVGQGHAAKPKPHYSRPAPKTSRRHVPSHKRRAPDRATGDSA